MSKYLQRNIVYPKAAKKQGLEGKVFTSFLIDEPDNISELKIIRSLGGGCDEEVLRVIQAMPRWTPGTQGGRPVKVRFNLPIEFKLK